MRSSARLTRDPLWQCLCPGWTAAPATQTRQCLVTARAALTRPAQNRTIKINSPNRPRRPFDTVLNPLRQPSQATIDAKTALDRSHLPTKTPQTSQTPRAPWAEETTPALYNLLRTNAVDRKVSYCRDLVRLLVEERHERPNVQMYHALILSHTNHFDGSAFAVSQLLDEMHAIGLHVDARVCHVVLKALAVHPDHLLRADVLEYMKERWYAITEDGMHDIVAGLLREGAFELALERIETMREEGMKVNGWLLDMAVYMFCEAGEIEEACRIMKVRLEAGELHLSQQVWWFMLDKASEARHYAATHLIWSSRVNRGYINPSSGICLNVLATAAGHGDTVLATEVFAHLSKRGTQFQPIHYELLMNSYMEKESPDLYRAFGVLCIMALERLEPGPGETRKLYQHLHRKPDKVNESLSMLRDLHSQGRTVPLAALNLLIECYVEQKNLAAAISLYKQIHTFVPLAEGAKKSFANAETFNLLLRGCRMAHPPDAQQASFLVSELVALGVPPTPLTFDRLMLVFLDASKHLLNPSTSTNTSSEVSTDESKTQSEGTKRAQALQLLDFAYRHFAEMLQLRWVPRFGTLRHLAMSLAVQGDARCWDVLQAGEDYADQIFGWPSRSRSVRMGVEKALEMAKALKGEAVDGQVEDLEARAQVSAS